MNNRILLTEKYEGNWGGGEEEGGRK